MKPAIPLFLTACALTLAACDQPRPRPAEEAAAPTPAGQAMPALPAWTTPLMGQAMSAAFPGGLGACVGNTDNVQTRYAGAAPGVEIVGWGWDTGAKAPIGRVILVDTAAVIVGGGETGMERPDVTAAKPEISSPTTGWRAYTSRTAGPTDTYGVLADGKTLCRLGHLEF